MNKLDYDFCLLKLSWKYNLLLLFTRIGIKIHFLLNCPVFDFVQVIVQISCRRIHIINYRKIEVSSATSLTFVVKSSERSLIQIRNRNGPSIDLWGTPASKLVHEEYCPFKTTLCFLKFKKLLMILNIFFLEVPFCFSLCKTPLCHTLPNAFEMSKNIPRYISYFLLLAQNISKNITQDHRQKICKFHES